MKSPDWTDAEFEVIEDPRPRIQARWTFWGDDFPNLAGLVCAVAAFWGLSALFHH